MLAHAFNDTYKKLPDAEAPKQQIINHSEDVIRDQKKSAPARTGGGWDCWYCCSEPAPVSDAKLDVDHNKNSSCCICPDNCCSLPACCCRTEFINYCLNGVPDCCDAINCCLNGNDCNCNCDLNCDCSGLSC